MNKVEEDNHLQPEATKDNAMANEKENTDREVQLLMNISKDTNKQNRKDDNDENRKTNKTSDTHGIQTEQYADYPKGTLTTELLMTQDIAAISADVEELLQQAEPQEHEYRYLDEEDEDAYKDPNSEDSEYIRQDDQSNQDPLEAPKIIDLLADSLAVMTVKDMYTDWSLQAEYSKKPERDVIITTNHPALNHLMEVKPKGLNKQVFNLISQNITVRQIET
jgi:hypothetical protein